MTEASQGTEPKANPEPVSDETLDKLYDRLSQLASGLPQVERMHGLERVGSFPLPDNSTGVVNERTWKDVPTVWFGITTPVVDEAGNMDVVFVEVGRRQEESTQDKRKVVVSTTTREKNNPPVFDEYVKGIVRPSIGAHRLSIRNKQGQMTQELGEKLLEKVQGVDPAIVKSTNSVKNS